MRQTETEPMDPALAADVMIAYAQAQGEIARAASNAAKVDAERREKSIVAGCWEKLAIALREAKNGEARRAKGAG